MNGNSDDKEGDDGFCIAGDQKSKYVIISNNLLLPEFTGKALDTFAYKVKHKRGKSLFHILFNIQGVRAIVNPGKCQ